MNGEFVQPEALELVERKRRRDRRIALGVTIVVHVILLLVFAAVTIFPALFQEPDIQVTMVAPTTQTVPSLSRQEVARMAPRTPHPSSSMRSAPLIVAAAPSPIGAPKLETVFNDAPVGLGLATGTGVGRGAFGQGLGSGVTGFSFMGVQATGRSLVLVIDISGSMVMQRGGDRAFEAVEEEAIRTLEKLPANTPFGIVMFAGQAHAFKDRLTPANSSSVKGAVEFIKSLSPARAREEAGSSDWSQIFRGRHAGTRTDLALQVAFAMDPETIVVLSDGQPSGTSAGQVYKIVADKQKQRGQPATVHTISYLSQNGRKFMEELATAHGGQFKAID